MIANPTLKLSNIISRVINMKVADQLIQKGHAGIECNQD